MRIHHLILTSRFAGSERYAIELANAQAAAGHDVTLVLRRAALQDRPDGLARHIAPQVRQVVVPNLLAGWHARRVLNKERPDVAHAHLSTGCRALRGLKTKTLRIASLHLHYKPQQHSQLDALIAIAPWQLAAIPEPLQAHTRQIDNWTLARPAAPDARAKIRTSLGIADDEVLIGALGRAEAGKGFDVLIDAFTQAKIDRARLAIVGNGKVWRELRARADATIAMPGFVAQPQDWLAAFDVFVSPARNEPFGLVFLEAMNAGLPIIATASQGAQHLAEPIGQPLVPIGDVGALAQALRAFAAQPLPRRVYAMQRFDVTARSQDIEAFYRHELSRLRR